MLLGVAIASISHLNMRKSLLNSKAKFSLPKLMGMKRKTNH